MLEGALLALEIGRIASFALTQLIIDGIGLKREKIGSSLMFKLPKDRFKTSATCNKSTWS